VGAGAAPLTLSAGAAKPAQLAHLTTNAYGFCRAELLLIPTESATAQEEHQQEQSAPSLVYLLVAPSEHASAVKVWRLTFASHPAPIAAASAAVGAVVGPPGLRLAASVLVSTVVLDAPQRPHAASVGTVLTHDAAALDAAASAAAAAAAAGATAAAGVTSAGLSVPPAPPLATAAALGALPAAPRPLSSASSYVYPPPTTPAAGPAAAAAAAAERAFAAESTGRTVGVASPDAVSARVLARALTCARARTQQPSEPLSQPFVAWDDLTATAATRALPGETPEDADLRRRRARTLERLSRRPRAPRVAAGARLPLRPAARAPAPDAQSALLWHRARTGRDTLADAAWLRAALATEAGFSPGAAGTRALAVPGPAPGAAWGATVSAFGYVRAPGLVSTEADFDVAADAGAGADGLNSSDAVSDQEALYWDCDAPPFLGGTDALPLAPGSGVVSWAGVTANGDAAAASSTATADEAGEATSVGAYGMVMAASVQLLSFVLPAEPAGESAAESAPSGNPGSIVVLTLATESGHLLLFQLAPQRRTLLYASVVPEPARSAPESPPAAAAAAAAAAPVLDATAGDVPVPGESGLAAALRRARAAAAAVAAAAAPAQDLVDAPARMTVAPATLTVPALAAAFPVLVGPTFARAAPAEADTDARPACFGAQTSGSETGAHARSGQRSTAAALAAVLDGGDSTAAAPAGGAASHRLLLPELLWRGRVARTPLTALAVTARGTAEAGTWAPATVTADAPQWASLSVYAAGAGRRVTRLDFDVAAEPVWAVSGHSHGAARDASARENAEVLFAAIPGATAPTIAPTVAPTVAPSAASPSAPPRPLQLRLQGRFEPSLLLCTPVRAVATLLPRAGVADLTALTATTTVVPAEAAASGSAASSAPASQDLVAAAGWDRRVYLIRGRLSAAPGSTRASAHAHAPAPAHPLPFAADDYTPFGALGVGCAATLLANAPASSAVAAPVAMAALAARAEAVLGLDAALPLPRVFTRASLRTASGSSTATDAVTDADVAVARETVARTLLVPQALLLERYLTPYGVRLAQQQQTARGRLRDPDAPPAALTPADAVKLFGGSLAGPQHDSDFSAGFSTAAGDDDSDDGDGGLAEKAVGNDEDAADGVGAWAAAASALAVAGGDDGIHGLAGALREHAAGVAAVRFRAPALATALGFPRAESVSAVNTGALVVSGHGAAGRSATEEAEDWGAHGLLATGGRDGLISIWKPY
jgi:hypothetical protein